MPSGPSAPPSPSSVAHCAERLFALSDDLLCRMGTDGCFREVNPAFERTLGWSPEELRGRPCFAFIHPDDRAASVEAMQRLAGGVTTTGLENRYRCRDGSYRWLSWRATPPDEAGQLYAVARDVTEQRRSEAERRAAEERFRIVQDASLDGFSLWEPVRTADGTVEDFVLVYANAVMERSYNHSGIPLVGRGMQELFPGARRSGRFGSYVTVLETGVGTDATMEYELDGRWLRMTVVRVGEGLGVTLTDVTERIQAEQLLRGARLELERLVEERTQALRTSEERFGLAFAGASDGVWDWNLLTHEHYASPGWKAQIGYADDELPGTHEDWSTRIHPDDRPRVLATTAEYLDGGRERFEVEYRLCHKDGRYRWILSRATAVRDATGRPVRLVGTNTDLTERKQLEVSVAQQARELQRSNEELERFAYAASHDLQEPLRMVTSFTMLLARKYEGQLDAKAQQYIHFAVDGATRMQRLIQDLLAYSRVGSRAAAFGPVDADAVLADTIRNLRVAIEESGATITHDRLPPLHGDATQIGQLLQNLLGNALKFRGAAAPVIHVGVAREGEAWQFSVRDNGIGIDQRHAARVFVMFQRLHTRAEYPGTGIGLALCRRIVERHGGRIWVESTPGAGSTFHFTLAAAALSHPS